MPGELQIIDDLERLRIAFARENSGFNPAVPDGAAGFSFSELPPAERVAAAWLAALSGGRGFGNGEQRRALRDQARKIAAPATPDDADGWRAGLPKKAASWLAERPEGFAAAMERAARLRLWPLDERAPERSLTEEAAAWERALPGLRGLAVWQFLKNLGRPALAADAPARRLLWRYGVLEKPAGAASAAAAQSAFERMARLSGLPAWHLAILLRWLAARDRNFSGGGQCGARPECANCALRGGCAWGRFHDDAQVARDSGETGEAEREQMRLAREAVLAGRQAELSGTELLALMLQNGAPGRNALALAAALLRRLGGVRGLERAALSELLAERGIAEGRAVALKAALELGQRLAGEGMRPGEPITCGLDVWRAYRGRFQHLPQEHFVALLLDKKHRVIADQVISKGTLDGSLAHPRDVFNLAVRHNAACVIVLHNHPSGDPAPSAADIAVTRQLRQAGEILAIKLLDHIILGAEGYYSFKEQE